MQRLRRTTCLLRPQLGEDVFVVGDVQQPGDHRQGVHHQEVAQILLDHAPVDVQIEAPTPAGFAGANTAVCPENESVPFSADCMLFIQGVGLDVRPRLNATDGVSVESPELP